MDRRAPLKKVNRKRKRKADARNFGEEAERVRAMPCLVARVFKTVGEERAHDMLAHLGATLCRGRVTAAHVVPRGMGGAKGDRFDLVPLCEQHHEAASEFGTSRRRAFEVRYDVDLRVEADRIAVEHPEPLGIRGLAERWAWHHEHGSKPITVTGNKVDEILRGPRPLDDYERESMLGWVRRFTEREYEMAEWMVEDAGGSVEGALAHLLEGELGIGPIEAWRLCEAAGWPT